MCTSLLIGRRLEPSGQPLGLKNENCIKVSTWLTVSLLYGTASHSTLGFRAAEEVNEKRKAIRSHAAAERACLP